MEVVGLSLRPEFVMGLTTKKPDAEKSLAEIARPGIGPPRMRAPASGYGPALPRMTTGKGFRGVGPMDRSRAIAVPRSLIGDIGLYLPPGSQREASNCKPLALAPTKLESGLTRGAIYLA